MTTDLERVYRERRTDFVRAAVLLLGDRAAAEEAVQEAFASLYRAGPRLRDRAAAPGYVYRSVVNECRAVLRRREIAGRRLGASSARDVDDAPGADAAVLAGEARAAVFEALGRLPQRQRECVVLRWYGDLSERDIANALGISGGSVKTHLHRGLAALAADLEVLR